MSIVRCTTLSVTRLSVEPTTNLFNTMTQQPSTRWLLREALKLPPRMMTPCGPSLGFLNGKEITHEWTLRSLQMQSYSRNTLTSPISGSLSPGPCLRVLVSGSLSPGLQPRRLSFDQHRIILTWSRQKTGKQTPVPPDLLRGNLALVEARPFATPTMTCAICSPSSRQVV